MEVTEYIPDWEYIVWNWAFWGFNITLKSIFNKINSYMNNQLHDLLQKALQLNSLNLSPDAVKKLAHYLALLQKWNAVYNLTSITIPNEMVYLHIIDSLSIQPYLNGKRLLDVGSGAGLPGIPLAIINPDQHWALLDKNSKKTRFQTQAIAELGLTNVEALHHRCEDFHPDQGFDTIVSRAFASLQTFVDTTQHLLAPDGIWLAMKGQYPEDEIMNLPKTVEVIKIERIIIKGINIDRHIVSLRPKK